MGNEQELDLLQTQEVSELSETQETAETQFQPMEFVDNLSYMGMGMLGIFVVIGVIIAITAALNKIFKK